MNQARKICIEMLKDREYIITDNGEVIKAIRTDGWPVAVFFFTEKKLAVKNLQNFIAKMNNLDFYYGIIIYESEITSFALKAIKMLKEIRFELFASSDLQYNITKHKLQPKFEKLDKKDGAQFKKKYGIKFGTIRIIDPISKYYSYSRGDVIKITRTRNNNDVIVYRICR